VLESALSFSIFIHLIAFLFKSHILTYGVLSNGTSLDISAIHIQRVDRHRTDRNRDSLNPCLCFYCNKDKNNLLKFSFKKWHWMAFEWCLWLLYIHVLRMCSYIILPEYVLKLELVCSILHAVLFRRIYQLPRIYQFLMPIALVIWSWNYIATIFLSATF